MSLELHHWEPNGASLALMICLREKGLDFDSRYVDVLELEQHEPGFPGLSAGGLLPVLVGDGMAMTDPGLALQYLTERYGEPRLAPVDASAWYDLQAWSTLLDGRFALAENVQLIGWNQVMLESMDSDELAGLRDRLASLPARKESGWNAVWSDAEAGEDQLRLATDRIAVIVGKIETALTGSDWILGDAFTIADIQAFGHAHCLPDLLPGVVNASDTPRVCEWLKRIGERESVRESIATARRDFGLAAFPPPGA